MRALRWLVVDSKPSDSLVFVFSGRSAQASPGEELQTGSSEGLLPVNYGQVLPCPHCPFQHVGVTCWNQSSRCVLPLPASAAELR